MTKHTREQDLMPRDTERAAAGVLTSQSSVQVNGVTETLSACHGDAATVKALPLPIEKRQRNSRRGHTAVSRGLTATLSTTQLRRTIWLRTLLIANRFRVIRTVDISVSCFAERKGFKASLTAAQRAMRGLTKAGLLKRYRSLRFQTFYSLTQRGVDWLDEAGHAASSSVRRGSDMTNPEHRLWSQFLVLACEARGLPAKTEQELLQDLNRDKTPSEASVQGLLSVTWMQGKSSVTRQLRPDAVASEEREDIGGGAASSPRATTWFEVDSSARGAGRAAALAGLAISLGRSLNDGSVLRRVVVFCKSERIRKRVLAVLHRLATVNNSEILTTDRRHFLEVEPGIFEVWSARKSKLKDGRTKLVDSLAGHVIIQLLPVWLPRVRIDSKNTFSMAGWFAENYLPYRRPASLGPWPTCTSPLLKPMTSTTKVS